jgi:hypothetical protein
MEKLDPAKDRNEFEKRLKYIFNIEEYFKTQDIINALAKEDRLKKKKYIDMLEKLQKRIDDYLAAWDVATTYEDKRAVVGSVKK